MGVAERVAAERNEEVGDVVGYTIRLDSKISKKTRLVFMTPGVLLRQLQSDTLLSGITHIILDEVHERDVLTDFLLVLLRELLQKRSDLKLILMSATVDCEMFLKYFEGCKHLDIPGLSFPVDRLYLEDVLGMTKYIPEYMEKKPKLMSNEEHLMKAIADYDKVDCKLVASFVSFLLRGGPANVDKEGAILVFLPGWTEILKVKEGIESNRNAHIILLHSMVSSRDQRQIFDPPPSGMRKVVLATNIAETSITIDDVTVVVDSARVKEMRYDDVRRMGILQEVSISKASATQRAGRAGRVRRGTCFCLVSKKQYEKMQEHTTPEILRVPLEDLVLQIELQSLGEPTTFFAKCLTPPTPSAVKGAIKNLVDLQALTKTTDDNQGNAGKRELTPLGFHLALLPCNPRLGKMLIYASIFGCLNPILTIAASMSLKTPFNSPLGQREQADAKKRHFGRGTMSDHLAWHYAYYQWNSNTNGKYDYCRKNYLNRDVLNQIKRLRDQLQNDLRGAGFITDEINHDRNSENVHLLRTILCAGLYPNVVKFCMAKRNGHGKPKRQINTKTENVLFHPASLNGKFTAAKDRWFVYLEKVETTAVFIRDSTIISPFGLLLFGGDLIVDHHKKLVTVDEWIKFHTPPAIGVLFKVVREELNEVLLNFIENPKKAIASEQIKVMTNGLADLLKLSNFENNLSAT
eukprot:m.75692 g.75692  ORF g.75692 m.75692 type:complete len:691 (-) comp12518_c0_seq1:97-2169(-)